MVCHIAVEMWWQVSHPPFPESPPVIEPCLVVPAEGFEPPCPFGHCTLNAARIPVSPDRHWMWAGFEPATCGVRPPLCH